MLKSLDFRFMETHIDTHIDLHPGVNVFTGESDHGKSGIVRNIRWNAENRPQGDAYRNDQLDPKKDKKVVCSSTINYHKDGVVTRERDNVPQGVNNYVIDNGDPLRALRTDVPQEVQDVTRMKSVNIQGQHPTEQYFLLADRPGKVAKEFNKVAGLTIMDDALAEINKQVRDCNAELKVYAKEAELRETQLKESEWVLDAQKFMAKLSKAETALNEKEEELHALEYVIKEIINIDRELNKFDALDDALEEMKEIEMIVSQIQTKNYDLNYLNETIASIIQVDLELNACIDTKEAYTALKTLEKLNTDIKKLEKENLLIQLAVIDIDSCTEKYKIADKEYQEVKKEHDLILEKEACPTCGRKGA